MDLREYLSPHGITLTGVLPLGDCRVHKPYLLERAGFDTANPSGIFVQLFAVPYLTPVADRADRNLSAYAVSEDYHLFMKDLYDTLLPRLRKEYPDRLFVGFADHSPIDEITAAVDAGMGVRGRNHLLLTERYSSYIFLGEIITDLPLTPTPTVLPPQSRVCHNCGACLSCCPMLREGGECRSALTQKKGGLSKEEHDTLVRFESVWGCDLCQEVCPYTAHARNRGTIYTEIPFFHKATIPHLTLDILDDMSDEAFSRRAFAWRGREVIRRNLMLKQNNNNRKES
jgi:epoxyqueuosine reductase QueG